MNRFQRVPTQSKDVLNDRIAGTTAAPNPIDTIDTIDTMIPRSASRSSACR